MTEKHFLATPVHMEVNGVLFVPIKALKKKEKKKEKQCLSRNYQTSL